MKLIEFTKRFPSEKSCKQSWKEYRIKQGVVCPHCGCTSHYWKQDKECFECKECGYRQSLRANTVMHESQLPFQYWFIAIHLLSSMKKGISALELQHQLGHKNYNPIWAMSHKLRLAMGKRDEQYKLSGVVELDEGFFTTETPDSEKDKPKKRGRGSQNKSKVLVMAETADSKAEPKKGQKPKNPESVIQSDHSTSYTNFKSLVKEHVSRVIPKELVGTLLPWYI